MATKANPEGIKWPTDKPRYDENHTQIFGVTCIQCEFYEKDHVNDDGDWVKGWGCCRPVSCPYGKGKK